MGIPINRYERLNEDEECKRIRFCKNCSKNVRLPHYCSWRYNENGLKEYIKEDGQKEEKKTVPTTKLLEKNFSPMIIRKYQGFGWPLFIAIICDEDLSDLDSIVNSFVHIANPKHLNGIQDIRNFCGNLSQVIIDEYNERNYGCVEGVAVIAYWDKCVCSSLYGDFMTHTSCRIELFSLLNMLPHV